MRKETTNPNTARDHQTARHHCRSGDVDIVPRSFVPRRPVERSRVVASPDHTPAQELHVSDDFYDVVAQLRSTPEQYPRLVAIALLLRHSWYPDDLDNTAVWLGLPSPPQPPLTSSPHSATADSSVGSNDHRLHTTQPPHLGKETYHVECFSSPTLRLADIASVNSSAHIVHCATMTDGS